MKFVDFKIYTVATVLIDLLDQTEGNSAYKHKLKFHINKTIKELEKITVRTGTEQTDQLVNATWEAIHKNIDEKLKGYDG